MSQYGTIVEEPENEIIVGTPHPFIYETFPQEEDEICCCCISMRSIIEVAADFGQACSTVFNAIFGIRNAE